MDRDRLLKKLEGYSAGPRMCRLLETFCSHQQLVPRHIGYHRPDFPDTRGMTQGDLVSPTLLNIVVDNVIRTWLAITVEYHRVAHNGLGEAFGSCLGVLYADDGMVGSRDLVGLFQRYGLAAKAAKSRSMTCQPGALKLGVSAESKALKCMGVVDSYHVRL